MLIHSCSRMIPCTVFVFVFVFVDDHSDEPLLSGSGVIDGNLEDSQLLERWRELLASWRTQPLVSPQRPSQLRAFVVGGGHEGPRGVPESVRGQVWPLLARAIPASALLTDALAASQRRMSGSPLTSSPAREPRSELSTSASASSAPSSASASSDARPVNGAPSYQELSARECAGEMDLQKDLARTFPQHEFFRQPEAAGQAALHRLCRVRTSLYSGYSYMECLCTRI